MAKAEYCPYVDYNEYSIEEMKMRSETFYNEIKRRRTVRDFADRPVPRDVIENCIRSAATAPSGANIQPWSFVVVTDKSVKKQLREAAEEVEREFYHSDKTKKWVAALEHLGTNEHKPFLEEAPCLIVVFAQSYTLLPDGSKMEHYYVMQSVGIATGILITAVHNAGLSALTYTPARTKFLNDILSRPSHEKPFLVLVVGYPKEGILVPDIKRKELKDVAIFV
jgi:nitroreductase